MGYMKDFDRRIRQGGDDAVRAALEYALTVAARWIPVEERLPDEGSGGVLGFRRSDIAAGEHSYGMAWNHGGKLAWNEPMTPTHWMPLPEPPEVK